MTLDEKDLQILSELQENCKITVKKLAKKIRTPITTVYTKIKRMEKLGFIKAYRAILDHKRLGLKTSAFIFISFSYETRGQRKLSQREVARKIASFPEVQEAHIITGDWDIVLKVRVSDIEELGKFIIDKLRKVEGVEKTLTCVVLDTVKETTKIPLQYSSE